MFGSSGWDWFKSQFDKILLVVLWVFVVLFLHHTLADLSGGEGDTRNPMFRELLTKLESALDLILGALLGLLRISRGGSTDNSPSAPARVIAPSPPLEDK